VSATSERRSNNAFIRGVSLGFFDSNPNREPTAWLQTERISGNQDFGGYDLREMPMFVFRVLETVGVSHWEKLPGTACRLMLTSDHRIVGIGHFYEERWYFPKEEYDEGKAKERLRP
jgi:hypothetical protein